MRFVALDADKSLLVILKFNTTIKAVCCKKDISTKEENTSIKVKI
jgi:predicted transposase YbfD/YdcC